MTAHQVYQTVYVKLQTLDVPENLADQIAKAAYQEALKIVCGGQYLSADARKERTWKKKN